MEPVPLNVIVENVTEMTELFAEVATGELLAPLLFLVGALLVAFSLAVFGGLTLAAVGSLLNLE